VHGMLTVIESGPPSQVTRALADLGRFKQNNPLSAMPAHAYM
jgi:hypothetical protein